MDLSKSYRETLNYVGLVLAEEKRSQYKNSVMRVGIEGPSTSGKSTFSENLSESIRKENLDSLVIDLDMFQRPVSEMERVIARMNHSVSKGRKPRMDYPEIFWRYYELDLQLLEKVEDFNNSERKGDNIYLEDVLEMPKKDRYSKTPFEVPLTSKSILLMPSMYLRHMDSFDYMIELRLDPEEGIRRKVKRDSELGINRSAEETRRMVLELEEPVTSYRREKFPIKKGMVIDMSNFNNVNIIWEKN